MKYFVFFYFIVDASDNMKGEKIASVNTAIQSLVPYLIDNMSEDNLEMYVRTLAYSDTQQWLDDSPTKIVDYSWDEIITSGNTSTKDMLSELISEFCRFKIWKKNILLIPVLFSGSTSNDNYGKALKELTNIPIFRRGIKVGVAVGPNANIDLLNQFTGNKELVFSTNHLHLLNRLIKWDDDGAWYDEDWSEEASIDTIYIK